MKKISTLYALLALLLFFVACQKSELKSKTEETTEEEIVLQLRQQADSCGVPLVKELLDMGGTKVWGSVVISNDNDSTTVHVSRADTGIYITKITLVYGTQDHVSQFLTSNIVWTPCEGPSQFDRQKTYAEQTTIADTLRIANTAFNDDSCTWLSVQVELKGTAGTLGCAYASPHDGPIFGSAQYQSAFQYCLQTCAPDTSICDTLRTQTPGGWGAPPNGNNPGAYLHANFANAFPDGIAVGCYPNDFYVRLTTAQAITDLLPTGGEPAMLKQNYTNPAEIKNVLVGHLVALALSLGFDVFDENFGAGGKALGAMYIGDGTFKGWTVAEFVAEANKVLGGCSTTYTAKQVQDTIEKINENYVDGNKDNGFLVCEAVPR